MRISSINLNLFRTKNVQSVTENQQNPFVANNTNNPFAGGLKSDIFQSSEIQNTQPNAFVRKTAEIFSSLNDKYSEFKTQAKEFFAPAISFAGKIGNSFEKIGNITLDDVYKGFKKEISLLSLDKDVRNYMKMPVTDLREELAKELA